MNIFIVGYENCCYYQRVCQKLPAATQITCDLPINSDKIHRKVIQCIHNRKPIDFAQLHFWSPQIICCTLKY